MKQYTESNLKLYLLPDAEYVCVDTSYIETYRGIGIGKSAKEVLHEVRKETMLMNSTPFAEFKANGSGISLAHLHKVFEGEAEGRDVFSTDTALVLVVEQTIFPELLADFSFDALLESDVDLYNETYWEALVSKYKFGSLGLMGSSGIGNGFDFDGSGRYRVVLD